MAKKKADELTENKELVQAEEKPAKKPAAKGGAKKSAKSVVAEENAEDADEFQTRLEKLVKQAKKKGDVLDYQEVLKTFQDMDLEDEKYDLITAYLESKGIDVLNLEEDQDDVPDLDDDDHVDDDEVPNEELEMIEQEEMDGEDDLDAHGVGDAINIEDPVRMYLKEIGKVPLLTADEEVAIAKRMENGDIAQKMLDTIFADVADGDTERVTTEDEFWKYLRNEEQREEADEKKPFLLGRNKQELKEVVADGEEARKKLAEANLRLVVSIAKRYVGRGMLFLDLIQEGNLGLIKAVEKFDFRKGFKFSCVLCVFRSFRLL